MCLSGLRLLPSLPPTSCKVADAHGLATAHGVAAVPGVAAASEVAALLGAPHPHRRNPCTGWVWGRGRCAVHVASVWERSGKDLGSIRGPSGVRPKTIWGRSGAELRPARGRLGVSLWGRFGGDL